MFSKRRSTSRFANEKIEWRKVDIQTVVWFCSLCKLSEYICIFLDTTVLYLVPVEWQSCLYNPHKSSALRNPAVQRASGDCKVRAPVSYIKSSFRLSGCDCSKYLVTWRGVSGSVMEVEVSTLDQMWRGSVCGRVCREECCNNVELFFESQNQFKTSQLFASIIPSFPKKYQKVAHYITSVPLSTNCVQNIFFSFEAWFCRQQFCECPVQGVLKVTVQRLYRDQRRHTFIYSFAPAESDVGRCSSSWNCRAPFLMYTEL